MSIVTGLSGNEIYCLDRVGLTPGDLVIGNSVYSMGFIGGITASVRTLVGGEVTQVTDVIHDGRQRAYERLVTEARQRGGVGVTGVTNELVWHGGNIEFLSVGSCVRRQGDDNLHFSSSADGQELFCQMDAGFEPIKFAFGNVAYSIGIGGGIGGLVRSLGRGEVKEYSDVFNQTRHLALERITAEAKSAGANAVVGIQTTLLPLMGMQEMVMIGTASRHPALPEQYDNEPITSDLTNQEMWNIIKAGYMPLRLVLGVSVYSLGLVGGVSSFFQSFKRGEIDQLTTLIYDARENAIVRLAKEADACGADDVVGIKTYISQLGGGIIEFMALGTAVKKMDGIGTQSDQLPPQAFVKNKDTFIKPSPYIMGQLLNQRMGQ
ncbi:MAG: heavy metal-binding domain-containing protein [Vulcanimicrobiota bacterium]